MTIKIITKTIENFVGSSSSLQLLLSLPEVDSKKKPISFTIYNKTTTNDPLTDKVSLVSYHYAVPYKNDVVSTVLLDTNKELYKEVSRQLSTIMAKKFQKPVYVAFGELDSSNNDLQLDQLFVLRSCVKYVEEELNKTKE